MTDFVAQIGLMSNFLLPLSDVSYGNSFGYTKRSETVEDRNADLGLRNLPMEVPRRKALPQQFHTLYPVSCRPTEILRI